MPDIEYIDNYKKLGVIANCAGDGLCGYAIRSELAFAYAKMLTENKHNGQVYNLHGEAITQYQLADYLNKAFGTDLSYSALSVEAYKQDRIDELGEFIGTIIAGIYQGIREGNRTTLATTSMLQVAPIKAGTVILTTLGLAHRAIKNPLSAIQIDNTVNKFLNQANSFDRELGRSETIPESQLFEFLRFISSDLLVTLNTFFEFSLSKVTENKLHGILSLAGEITQPLGEVDQINLSTKILSFNANVEAARAGEIGNGLAVVPKEMNALSSQTKLVSERIKKSIDAFIGALES